LVGEVAHIVGEKPTAARGDDLLDPSGRNEPDNLILLCRRHHKIVDDNQVSYSVSRMHAIRQEYLDWLTQQLEPAVPWQIRVSAFAYLNLPRLGEYAAMQGFRIPHDGPAAGQSLKDLGFELNRLMHACQRTLENLSIVSVSADRIRYLHDDYTGQILNFDRLRFRTKNIPVHRPSGGKSFEFAGNLARDPHVYHSFASWTLVLNIDPRWITTSTAYTLFRPSGGHSLFTGFARITNVDLDKQRAMGTALAVGVPMSAWDIALINSPIRASDAPRAGASTPNADVDFESLEDDVSKSRGDFWYGDLENCDLCGRDFAQERYMIDGPIVLRGPWGCMCGSCYSKNQLPLGIGKGQLYRKMGERWHLVGGYPRIDLEGDDD
jgi:hypothetical protein